jgi:hypothetical protein
VQNLGRLEMVFKSFLYTGEVAMKELLDIERGKETKA